MTNESPVPRWPRTPVELIAWILELAAPDWGAALRVTVILTVLLAGVIAAISALRDHTDFGLIALALLSGATIFIRAQKPSRQREEGAVTQMRDEGLMVTGDEDA